MEKMKNKKEILEEICEKSLIIPFDNPD